MEEEIAFVRPRLQQPAHLPTVHQKGEPRKETENNRYVGIVVYFLLLFSIILIECVNTCTLTVLGARGGVILFQMCLYSLHDTTCLKPKARVNKTRAMHPILLHILSVFYFFSPHHFFSSSFFVFFFPSLFFFSTSPTTFTSCVECRRSYSPHSLLGYLLFFR